MVACNNANEVNRPASNLPDSALESTTPKVHFRDITSALGVNFEHVSGTTEQRFILESMAGGGAFFDYDNDGDLDLFLTNASRTSGDPPGAEDHLYRNDGNTFTDVSSTAGVKRSGWSMGCAVADYDRDGDLDLYVTAWGPNGLYRNNGDGTFTDVAQAAGVDDHRWGTSAAFGDLDGDGFLDLYVNNYVNFNLSAPPGGGTMCSGWKGLTVFCGPQGMEADADILYRNNRDGTFADVSNSNGIDRRLYPGLGVVFFDAEADGDLDIYVANDSQPNLLYRNDGDWNLVEVGAIAGVAYSEEGRSQAGMGVDAGDYDNDGDFDLVVTNFSDDVNTLYRNDGTGQFVDATFAAALGGPVRPYLGWSTSLCDFDNDGDLDLYVANGHLYPQLDSHPLGLRYAQRDLLYWNNGGRFQRASDAGLEGVRVSRGAAFGDFDNDGDTDVAVMHLNDRPSLLLNENGNTANWLGLDLRNADGSISDGAVVRLTTGNLELVRQAKRSYGYLSASDGRLLLGLGQRKSVDRVDIQWPSGHQQTLQTPPTRRYLLVYEGEPAVDASYPTPPQLSVLAKVDQAPPPGRRSLTTSPTLDPDWTAAACYDTITALYRQGRYAEALDLARPAIETYPQHTRLYYAAGVALYSGQGRYAEAAQILEAAMVRDPSMIEIAKLLGVVYLNLNRPTRAITALQHASLLDSTAWEIPYQLGLAHQRAGETQPAIFALERAQSLAPQEPMPQLHLARLYALDQRYEEAKRARQRFDALRPLQEEIARYRQSVAANPHLPAGYNELALVLARADRLEEANEQLEKAVQLNPSYAEAHTNLGNVLQRLGRTENAMEHYTKAIVLDPDQAEAHYGLGMSLHAMNRSNEAVRTLQHALRIRPDYIRAHTNVGILLDAQKRSEEAIYHFERAAALAPEDATAVSNFVVALLHSAHIDSARSVVADALDRRLNIPLARKTLVQVLVALAHSHASKTELQQAVARQQQAIALTPEKFRPALQETLWIYQNSL